MSSMKKDIAYGTSLLVIGKTHLAMGYMPGFAIFASFLVVFSVLVLSLVFL
jgi:hypothetical protein